MNKTIGFILIVLGVIGLALGGLSFTTKEKIVDIGPIEASREKRHQIPLAPIAGGVVLLGGIVLLVSARKN